MATRTKSAANGPNRAEIPSKSPFWKGSGAPARDAENGHQGQIRSIWAKLTRNPIEKDILDVSRGL